MYSVAKFTLFYASKSSVCISFDIPTLGLGVLLLDARRAQPGFGARGFRAQAALLLWRANVLLTESIFPLAERILPNSPFPLTCRDIESRIVGKTTFHFFNKAPLCIV